MSGKAAQHTMRRIDSSVSRERLSGIAATRRIEHDALGCTAPFELMARAGEATARLAQALAPHARHIVVFAGPGNNGGDGLEAATRLRGFGKHVRARLCADAASLPSDAALAHARALQAGVEVGSGANADASLDGVDLVIDALLGIGASRPPEGDLATAIGVIAELRSRGAIVLSIDVPSGFDADRGQALGKACVEATHTLSLLTLKPGLFTASGRDVAGTVWLDTLGIDPTEDLPDAWLVGRGIDIAAIQPRRHAQHKGSFGDVAVVGGARGMAGAAVLAARSAHAAGAGRVFLELLDPGENTLPWDPMRPELMARHGWTRQAGDALAHTTVVCGCGGGDAVREVLPLLLSRAVRLVVDADALNAIAVDSQLQTLATLRAAKGMATVFTPHPLEAARLLGTSAAQVQADRLVAAQALVDRYGCVIVLKGSGTVIAAPGSAPAINATGNASLAGAGTGDVLAGWIGGRWGRGGDAMDVATQAVVEHGAAAEPDAIGALRAGDLIERLHRLSRGE